MSNHPSESATGAGPEAPAPVPADAPARDLWWEVTAVLAVGVVPHVASAISHLCQTLPPQPYWLDAFNLAVTSGCTLLVMLFLIGRTGEPWAKFGFVRPQLSDLPNGGLFFLLAVLIWQTMPSALWSEGSTAHPPAAPARGILGYALLVVKYTLSAGAEEVVTRAYLVTRLADLMRSRGEAVFVSAVLFASYHAYQGVPGVVYAFAFGTVYGVAFLVTGRIWPLVVGHALYNISNEVFFG